MRTLAKSPAGWVPALLVAALAAATPPSTAESSRDQLEQTLDQNVRQLQIDNLPIREAFARIEQQTSVRLVLDASVAERMPYGDRTQISLQIKDLPLRKGLTQALDALGLVIRVEGDGVHVDPAAVLERLGRRLTIVEAGLLAKLATGPWGAATVNEIPLRFEIDPATAPRSALEKTVALLPGPNALRQLDAATQTLGWAWIPEGDAIVFLTRRDFVRRQLELPIDVNCKGVALDDLLIDLGRRTGLTVLFEAGALHKLDARDQKVSLVQRRTTFRQVLERLQGTTGLRYQAVDAGVQIAAPPDASNAATSPGRVVAQISIRLAKDKVRINLPVFENEVPADLLAKLREKGLEDLNAVLRGDVKVEPADD